MSRIFFVFMTNVRNVWDCLFSIEILVFYSYIVIPEKYLKKSQPANRTFEEVSKIVEDLIHISPQTQRR